MKKVLTVLLMAISSLLFSGCLGFSVMCVQDTNVETMELEIMSLRIHYVTQYGEIIEIYEYKKKEENDTDRNVS
jgi:hypothetical protein